MLVDTLRRLLVFVLLCLVQVLVLGRIQLFHMAWPLLYVYFVIIFPRHYPHWVILIWSFALGLCMDMFTNTPGVAAAALTLTGMLQPYLLELFLPRDAEENIKASAASLGMWRFASLAAILTAIYCLTYFALEQFTFFNWLYWLQCAGSSALLSFILMMTLESVRK